MLSGNFVLRKWKKGGRRNNDDNIIETNFNIIQIFSDVNI